MWSASGVLTTKLTTLRLVLSPITQCSVIRAPLSVGRFAAFFTVKLQQAGGRMMEEKGSAGLGLLFE
ncbi:hypothetical protein PAHAL_8G100300 [Panicum hallii]|jgi:hypothetical protein|uniref:Uncharacterized protein n=1 Tax=Panicum hallii TaxID=206008 RepID=A0A2S3IDS9_9POAL|nr:hypothetical protein PAHAL_8G100300 [Panicum hallii]